MNKICFIPIKHNSKRVIGKNLRLLGDKPLYQHTLDIVKDMECFSGLYVDTDSDVIIEYCNENGIDTIERIPELLNDSYK